MKTRSNRVHLRTCSRFKFADLAFELFIRREISKESSLARFEFGGNRQKRAQHSPRDPSNDLGKKGNNTKMKFSQSRITRFRGGWWLNSESILDIINPSEGMGRKIYRTRLFQTDKTWTSGCARL